MWTGQGFGAPGGNNDAQASSQFDGAFGGNIDAGTHINAEARCLPAASDMTPSDGARDVATSSTIRVVLPCSADYALKVFVQGREVEGSALWAPEQTTLSFIPSRRLGLATTYVVEAASATTGFRYSWSFTTRDGAWRSPEIIGRGDLVSVDLNQAGDGIVAFGSDTSDHALLSARRFLGDVEAFSAVDSVRDVDRTNLHDLHAGSDDAGGLLVAWVEYTIVNSSGGYRVWSRRGWLDGAWDAVQPVGPWGGFQELHDVALRDGSGLVLSSDNFSGVGGRERLLSVEAAEIGKTEPTVVADQMPIDDARLALEPGGGAWAAWGSWSLQGLIMARHRDPTGAWGELIVLRDGQARAPSIAADGNGRAMTIWEETVDKQGVVAASLFAPTAGWSAAQPLDTEDTRGTSSSSGFYTRVAMDPFGNALALWINRATFITSQTSSTTSFGNIEEVRSQRFDAKQGWSPGHERLDPASSNPTWYFLSDQALALDPQGNGFAAWRHGDPGDVRVARWTIQSGWQESVQLTANGRTPVIAVDARGRALAVWSTLQGDVYAARFAEP